MRFTARLLHAALLVFTVPPLAGAQPDRLYHLDIGDPARRGREVPVVLDGITASASGDVIAPDDLVVRLEDTRLVLIGESHTSLESHRVQLRVIEALAAAGRRVLVGLEMYARSDQEALDRWNKGYLTERGFVPLGRWFENWGYNWRYYRDIFVFARDNRIPLFGVNTPREVITAVRKKGFKNLTPEEASNLPPDGVDTSSADHMTFFKSSFDDSDTAHGAMNDEAWASMLNAQAAWDATMGWNALQILGRDTDPRTVMVVLAGSGHVAYGVGIERQARRWFNGPIATIIAVPIAVPSTGVRVNTVRASYAGYVWGVPPDSEQAFPTLGITTKVDDRNRRVVVDVDDDSAAAAAGLEPNDIILSMDGEAIVAADTLTHIIARKQWGDSVRATVLRGSEERTLVAYLRRRSSQFIPVPPTATPPAAPKTAGKTGPHD
jgi:uncharacterized iron-regulated protein